MCTTLPLTKLHCTIVCFTVCPDLYCGFLVLFAVSAGIDYGQPWRRTFGDNIVYTDWQKDNFFYAVKQQVCGL